MAKSYCLKTKYALTDHGIGTRGAWLAELSDYLAEDAWARARFYDTKLRTRRAAVAAYERFVAEHPDSSHADEARARIARLKDSKNEGTQK